MTLPLDGFDPRKYMALASLTTGDLLDEVRRRCRSLVAHGILKNGTPIFALQGPALECILLATKMAHQTAAGAIQPQEQEPPDEDWQGQALPPPEPGTEEGKPNIAKGPGSDTPPEGVGP